MLQIGITGGIGTGKSIICKVFASWGTPVYEADSRAKWLMQHDVALKEAIQQHFGEQAYSPNGELNRLYLAQKVFSHEAQTQKINSLVHPAVAQDYAQWLAQQSHVPYILNEAALMFEAERDKAMDRVITVYAPKNIRIERILQRDKHRTTDDIEAIMQKQLSEEEKMRKADFIIYNDNSQPVLPQILHLHHLFCRGI